MRAPFQVLVVPFRTVGRTKEFAVFERADLHVWQFVAGGGQLGESPRVAAIREASEELGVKVKRVIALQTRGSVPTSCFKARKRWPKHLYVIPEHCFAVDCTGIEIHLSEEHVESRWGTFDETNALLNWDSNRTALWELSQRLRSTRRAMPRHRR